MYWVTVLALALSSSIDNFGVGITYGIRGMRISSLSNFIISIIAFVFSETGIIFGQYLSIIMPGIISALVGALFLVIIGFRIILLSIPKKRNALSSQTSGYLSMPEKADLDQSGNIDSFEAIILGIAVSMNALTNGLGAGLIGLPPLAISLSAALFSFLAIWWGSSLGRTLSKVRIGSWTVGQFSTILSGILLLLIAVKTLL